jgi:hypothetical protein
MKNSQRAGSQEDRAGTGWVRRWWIGELSVRLFEVAFVLVLAGALAWNGWFASASQSATWTSVLVSIAVVGAVAPRKRRSRMSRSRWRDLPAWGRPGRGEPSRSRGLRSRGSRSLRPAVVSARLPADRGVSGAAGAGVFAVVMRGRPGTAAWSGVGTGCEVCHGRLWRVSPGLVMAGTGGRAGPAGCWLAWTTTALSRSGICGRRPAGCGPGHSVRPGRWPKRWAWSASGTARGVAVRSLSGGERRRLDLASRRRSPPRPRRDLQRGRHPGARAHRLDHGGRVGGTTLVPLGTAALAMRDTLEG